MSKKAQKAKVPPAMVEGQEKVVLITDYACQYCGRISWEGIYDTLEM